MNQQPTNLESRAGLINRICHNLGATRRAWLLGGVSLSVLITGQACATEKVSSFPEPSAVKQDSAQAPEHAINSAQMTTEATSANIDLARRASEYGQRVRTRFLKSQPTSSVINYKPATKIPTSPIQSKHAGSKPKATNGVAQVGVIESEIEIPVDRETEATRVIKTRATNETSSDSLHRDLPERSVLTHPPREMTDVAVPTDAGTVPATSPETRAVPNRSAAALFADLHQRLTSQYPHSGLKLNWLQGSLFITGVARDRQEAIQIVAMVRETFLVPVVDRLQVPRAKAGSNR